MSQNYDYGKKIDQEKAQLMYKSYLKIKTRSVTNIKNALGDDNESIRMHCGKNPDDTSCSTLDVGFVMSVDCIRAMLTNIPDNNGGLVIFFGTRDREDSVTENTEGEQGVTYTDVDGRPTLIAFPYTEDASGDMAVQLDQGYEHPGTIPPGTDTPTDGAVSPKNTVLFPSGKLPVKIQKKMVAQYLKSEYSPIRLPKT
jgi:hypothetical protein